jgi:hypothetical protein
MFAQFSKSSPGVARRASTRSFGAVAIARPAAIKTFHHIAAASLVATALVIATAPPRATDCHCQVPCGIFNDPIRVALLREHATTIKKAMIQIDQLAENAAPSGEQFTSQDFNQAARWVATKEEAATAIMTIVSEYMLAQRVKKDSFQSVEEYHKTLELHHALLQSAMKTKQTVDLGAVVDLEHAIAGIAGMYTK